MRAIARSTPCLDLAVALKDFHRGFTLSHANGIDEVAGTGALLAKFLDLRHALQLPEKTIEGTWRLGLFGRDTLLPLLQVTATESASSTNATPTAPLFTSCRTRSCPC